MQDTHLSIERTAIVNKTAKPLLWLSIGSMIMVFAGLTSAYIVRHADAREWISFKLPYYFWFSSAIILLSSVTMNHALSSAKKNNYQAIKTAVLLTLVLGVVFCLLQILGWQSLIFQGIRLSGNVSGGYLYILSGLHFAHVLAGLIALTVVYFKSVGKKYDSQNHLGLRLCAIFWHFLDGLWIYLFLFLIIIR